MFYRHNDPWRRPTDPPRWLWLGSLIVLTLLLLWMTLDKLPAKSLEAPPTTARVEELYRQLDDLKRQSDELGTRLEEDLRLLQFRRSMEEKAEAAGTDPELVSYAWDQAADAGLDPTLVLAVIDQESGWNASLVHANDNGTRDWGLAQINDVSLHALMTTIGVHDPLDPQGSVRMGVYKLAYLSRLYGGDTDKILTSYNRGIGGLQTWLASRGTPRSPYSEAVLARREG